MLFAHTARFEGERGKGVADQETGSLVETHDRKKSIARQGVEPQEALLLCEEGSIDLTETPRLLEVRL